MIIDKGDKFLLLADPEGGFTLVAEDRDGFKAGSTRFRERVDASKFFMSCAEFVGSVVLVGRFLPVSEVHSV